MNTKWHLLDANEQILGRLASQVAQLLMGKHKPGFNRYHDQGDYVVVINADKIKTTGKKEEQKLYDSFSGYPSGLKQTPLKEVRRKKPAFIIEHAVSGMLPKNKLKPSMLSRLKIYLDDQHPYADKFKN